MEVCFFKMVVQKSGGVRGPAGNWNTSAVHLMLATVHLLLGVAGCFAFSC